jgi:hypothetical protein
LDKFLKSASQNVSKIFREFLFLLGTGLIQLFWGLICLKLSNTVTEYVSNCLIRSDTVTGVINLNLRKNGYGLVFLKKTLDKRGRPHHSFYNDVVGFTILSGNPHKTIKPISYLFSLIEFS